MTTDPQAMYAGGAATPQKDVIMQLGWSFRAMLGLGVILMLAACVPYSQAPLSDPRQAVVDAALIGTWRGGDPDERIYVHIGVVDAHRVRILTVEHNHSGELNVDEYSAHSSHSDGRSYLNIVEQGAATKPPGFILVRYRVDGNNVLKVAMPKIDGIKAAIKSGALAGRVEEGVLGDAIITAAPADTAAYLNDHQAELFGDEVTLNRLD
jgi:hypothetical protein